jgi:hypothetical protein
MKFDDAVENSVFVVAGFDVFDEVGHGDRGFLGVQFDDDVAVVGGQFDLVMITTHSGNSWISGHCGPFTGSAVFGQGAQFSVPDANFEAVFHLRPIKCDSLQARSVSCLTASAMIAALFCPAYYGHALVVQGSYEQAHCRPYLECQDRPCRAGQFPAADHPGRPGLGQAHADRHPFPA